MSIINNEITTFDGFWQSQFLDKGSRAPKPATLARRGGTAWRAIAEGLNRQQI
jgi:hypothetical protein